MYLDIRTLDVAVIIVCSVFGPVSFALGAGQPHARPSRFWGGTLLALAGGLALMNLQAHDSAYVANLFGPVLFALSLTLAQACARSARGIASRDVLGWTLFALFALALLAVQYMADSAALTHILKMELLGLLACKTAFEFNHCRELREGRPMQMVAAMMCLLAAAVLIEGIFGSPRRDAIASPESDLIEIFTRVGLLAGVLLCTTALWGVMTERMARIMQEIVSLDPLTGALNRPAFILQVEREISRTRRRADSRFTVILLNVDQLRRINDARGHAAGDQLLVKVVEALRSAIRDYDQIGRLGGDSFMLLLPGTWGENAAHMAERAKKKIRRYAAKNTAFKNPVSVAIGIAVFGENGEDWDTLLRAAETAIGNANAPDGNGARVASR